MSAKLPKLVVALTNNHSAWIVGSAADPKNTTPRDYDVVVPYSEWGKAAHLIPRDARPTTLGGWKVISDGVEVDVWPGELAYCMTHGTSSWVWQPFLNIRFKKIIEPVQGQQE